MKTITEMTRELGGFAPTTKFLERFAELVRADEREENAKVCESLFDLDDDSCNEAERCAAAIRARGQA
jgi:hypothetical protein